MKAKLIKMVEGYTLSLTGNIDDLYGISNQQLAEDHQLYKLSLKNCEAIANGYDLDELAYTESEDFVDNFDYNDGYGNICRFNNSHEAQECYIKGFQKAIELLGDKKFSINDMEKLMFATLEFTDTQEEGETYPFFKSFIQSLQQTEWDVEIGCYIGNGDEESDSFKDPLVTNTGIPKLDADGCLVLKRK